jgi:hypothetical protein
MKRIGLIVVAVLLLVVFTLADVPTWKVELDDPVQLYEFLRDGKYLFFNSDEYAWLYDASTGQKVWSLEVKGYEKKGVHELVGERYLVGTSKGLNCYDAITGQLLWQKEYKGIDQDDYMSLEFIENICVLRYGEPHLGIDLETGNEIWRLDIRYDGSLADRGTFNYSFLSQQRKMLVMEKGDKVSLFDVVSGKKVLELKDYEINGDLVKENKSWMYKAPDQKYVLVVLDDGAAVVDIVNNRELVKKKFDIDGDYEILLPTATGCAVFGDKQIVHFDFTAGTTLDVPYSIDDMRTYRLYAVGDQDILLIGAKDRMAAVDLRAAKLLWQTAKDDLQFDGYAHRYIKQEGEDAIITYNSTKLTGTVGTGTALYLISVNLLTGKLNWRVHSAHWEGAITGLARTMGKLAGALASFVGPKSGGRQISASFGYDNIGFDYDVKEVGGNLLVMNFNKVTMINPETGKSGGEGFCMVEPATGRVVYRSYFEMKNNSSWGAAGQGVVAHTPEPLFIDNAVYVCGNARVMAFDVNEGKRLWVVEKELKDGYPTDIVVIDGVVYVKFGKDPVKPGLEKNSIRLDSPWEKDPHGFAAIDVATGKLLWRVETKKDPGLMLPQFSIANYYHPVTKQLYFADEENLYALQLRRDGGKYDWTLNLDKNKIGDIPPKKMYAINETWLGSVPRTTTTTHNLGGGWTATTTSTSGGVTDEGARSFIEDAFDADVTSTYTSWGNIWGVTAKRCLRVLFDEKQILVFGMDGIGLIDIATGKPKWTQEWDYDYEAVQYIPRVHNGKVLYCVDRKMTCIDLASGKQLWQTKEAKKPRFFASPDQTFIFSIEEDVIKGYALR